MHLYIDGILAKSKEIDESPIGGHDMWIGSGFWVNYPDDDFEFASRPTSCGSIFEPTDLNQDCDRFLLTVDDGSTSCRVSRTS